MPNESEHFEDAPTPRGRQRYRRRFPLANSGLTVAEPPVEVTVRRHAAIGTVIEPTALDDPPEMPPTCDD
jgi:hypothetical protein